MLTNSSTDAFQPNLFGYDLLQQLDPADPLLHLGTAIPWQDFEQAFRHHYTAGLGAPSKPIRLMVGLMLLKQLENSRCAVETQSILPMVLWHDGISTKATLP